MKKIVIGSVLAGLAMFIWSALAHTVLPVGRMGIKLIPNEEAVLAALKANVTETGFYFFPGMDESRSLTPEEQKAWAAKYEGGPTGVMVVHPAGSRVMGPSQLLTELGADILACLLAAWLLVQLPLDFCRRTLAVALLGPIAWLSYSVSYWNWYGFPTAYVAAEAIDQVVGWFLAGLILSAIVKPAPRP